MKPLGKLAPLGLVALLGCESGGEAQALTVPAATCELASAASGNLPEEVRETSGLAQSRRNPQLFWTHNDAGNGPELFAFDGEGRLAQRITLPGVQAVDWEDIESGDCDGGACLFVGDIGDNDAERQSITVYRVAEPEAGSSSIAAPVALSARYPNGPRDAESLFRLPNGDLFLVTKGREGPIELYRYPAAQQGSGTATLERVRELFPQPGNEDDRVTGATASPDGRWVGIRSYRNLYLYRADALTGAGAAEPLTVDLTPLGHGQGEAVVITADGTVWLTTEAANKESRPAWARLRCTLPGE